MKTKDLNDFDIQYDPITDVLCVGGVQVNPQKNMKPPYKENGLRYGYGANGERVCLGAYMGRPNIIPADYAGEKLNLRKVPFVDGGYDAGGAYWGTPVNLWCAWGETATEQTQVFVRAVDRDAAKLEVYKLFSVQSPAFKS
jgi:hypothetical protein